MMNLYRFTMFCCAAVLMLCQPAWAIAFQGIEKIKDPDLLEQAEKSFEPVKVIITLKGCEDVKDIHFGKDAFAKSAVQSKVARIQDNVLSRMPFDNSRIWYRMENLPIIAGDITYSDLKSLAGLEDVVSIEKDCPLELDTTQGLGLMNTGSYRHPDSGKHVAVAIVDTGVDYTHPALGGGGFPNLKVLGGYDIGENDADPMDNEGHGSSCAGISAGLPESKGNYRGGVAPGAGIYALKVTDRNKGIVTSWLLGALDWCVSHQYDSPDQPIMIISASISRQGYYSESYCDNDVRNSPVSAVLPALDLVVANGIAVFISSGNGAKKTGIPFSACMKDTIAVGAVYDDSLGLARFSICSDLSTAADQVTCYSNSAPILDLLAPSHNAYTPSWPNGKYDPEFGGTSAACPYAAGAAALIQSYHKEKTGRFLSVKELRQLMTETGYPIQDQKSGITTPRVNITKALQSLNLEGDRSEGGGESNRAIDQLRDLLKDANQ